MPGMWPPLGGLGAAGSVVAGGGVVDGHVREMEIVEDGTGGAVVRWAWDQPVEGSHAFWVLVDGEPLARGLDGADGVGLDPMGGEHEVEVVAVRVDADGPPAVGLMAPNVDRVLLQWSASTDADVVAYRVYSDGGTGTVDTETPAGVVEGMVTPVGLDVGVSSGTGSGRIDIGGTYRGAAGNALWSVTVGAGGTTWTFSDQDGASGETRDLVPGAWMDVSEGVRVRFVDGAAAYDEGDTWEFRVGVATRWVSEPIEAAGTWKFQVGAVDRAGNEGTLSSAVSVAVAPEPRPPANIAAVWDAGSLTLTVTWTASETAGATYRVYANWNVVTEELEDWVIEENAAWTASETELAVTFDAAPGGEVRLYVRAVAGGIEERNADLVRVTCGAVAVAVLEAASVRRVTAVAGGHVEVEWDQAGAVVPSGFAVYRSTSASWDDAVEEEVVTFASTKQGDVTALPGVSRHVWSSAAVGPYAESAAWFGVRGLDGDDVAGPVSNLVAVTPDGTAPGQVAGLRGTGV